MNIKSQAVTQWWARFEIIPFVIPSADLRAITTKARIILMIARNFRCTDPLNFLHFQLQNRTARRKKTNRHENWVILLNNFWFSAKHRFVKLLPSRTHLKLVQNPIRKNDAERFHFKVTWYINTFMLTYLHSFHLVRIHNRSEAKDIPGSSSSTGNSSETLRGRTESESSDK